MFRPRHDWHIEEVEALLAMPFNDLMFKAHQIHRDNFSANHIQISTLLSIKTGACPEDCGYCSQSSKHKTTLESERLLPLETVIESAQAAQRKGATRFCMGAAWRNPTDTNLGHVIEMVRAVKAIGMETCITLGMLTGQQAQRLKTAGLDYYNHNLDASPEFYGNVITTHTYQDRLDTLGNVRNAGINICSGGILGMGESRHDRASLLQQLANLKPHPDSVPLNDLVRIEGTPLATSVKLEPFEFIRVVAAARIMMPKSYVRLSSGRIGMTDEMQAWCFFAGANSIFYGERLLTTDNPSEDLDKQLFTRLGLKPIGTNINSESQ